LTVASVLESPGMLGEAQARAMIRVARGCDPDAELAGWMLVWQFSSSVLSIARREQRLPGGEGPRAAVCTALAELWSQIYEIDLDTNRASIFFALFARARRAVIPSIRRVTPADRVARSATPPEVFCDDRLLDLARHRCRPGVIRPLPEVPVCVEPAVPVWADVTGRVADAFADEMADRFGWDRDSRYFAGRWALLHGFLACRIAEARTGERRSAPAIADTLGASRGVVKQLQADVNRVLRQDADVYRQALQDAVASIKAWE
jgi:hypothetical protein